MEFGITQKLCKVCTEFEIYNFSTLQSSHLYILIERKVMYKPETGPTPQVTTREEQGTPDSPSLRPAAPSFAVIMLRRVAMNGCTMLKIAELHRF